MTAPERAESTTRALTELPAGTGRASTIALTYRPVQAGEAGTPARVRWVARGRGACEGTYGRTARGG